MMPTFGIEYQWRDGMYVLPVEADSAEDAMERVRKAAHFGKCFTPNGMQKAAVNSRAGAEAEISLRRFAFNRPAFNRGVDHLTKWLSEPYIPGWGDVLMVGVVIVFGGGFVLVWKMWGL